MKRQTMLLLALLIICIIVTGCVNDDAQYGVASVRSDTAQANDGVDVDLTVLSATMVYAEVFNIMSNPDDYLGKTIRAAGLYYSAFYDVTGVYYHFIYIEDAAACCSQGLEFMLSDELSYPDYSPLTQTRIEIVGVFDSYIEESKTYHYLIVDDIVII